MMKLKLFVLTVSVALVAVLGFSVAANAAPNATLDCSKQNSATFFGIPAWYEYLKFKEQSGSCVIDADATAGTTAILILLAVIDILIRVSALAAVVFIVYGGFMFVISQGEPAKIVSARKTIINAVVGLAIALLASQIVKFVAKFLI